MRVIVTGAAGMLGSALVEQWRALRPEDEVVGLRRSDVDLIDQERTATAIASIAPDAVIHAAARVGGIEAKLGRPATFLGENLRIDSNVISAAISTGVRELLYISSGAIYPMNIDRALREDDLLAGPLEGANEGYALAKIVGGKLCAYASQQYGFAYRTAVPSNLYGPGDDFSPGRAHLVASALAKVQSALDTGASSVEVWGNGTARREFTYSLDLAGWLVTQVGSLDAWPLFLNLGVGVDHSVREYYEAAARVVGFDGELDYDPSRPSGVMRRLLDSSAARTLGWNPLTSLDEGYAATYEAFRKHQGNEKQPHDHRA